MKPRVARVRPSLEVFALASTSVEPCRSTFYHPPQERRLEAVTVRLPTHHEQQPSTDAPGPLYQPAGIAPIGPDRPQPGRPAQQFGAIPVLDVGSMHRHGQNQHQGVPIRCGACVRGPFGLRRSLGSPFCRGLDRLAIGKGGTGRGRPSFSLPNPGAERLFGALPGPIVTPVAKVPQTVPHSGESWGIMRHGMLPRNTYSMPFTVSRKSGFEDALGGCLATARELIRPIGRRLNIQDRIFDSRLQERRRSCPQPRW